MARGRNSKGDKDEPETGSLEVGMLCKSSFNDNELDSYLRQGEIKASEKPPHPIVHTVPMQDRMMPHTEPRSYMNASQW